MKRFPTKPCLGCGRRFEPTGGNQRFHSAECRKQYRSGDVIVLGSAAMARRGAGYEDWVAGGWPQRVEAGLSLTECARLCGVSRQAASAYYSAWREDQATERQREGWSRSPEVEALLEDFEGFRRHYFQDERGLPYVTAPFHQRWIDSMLAAMSPNGRRNLMILSPPRHGKTQLLIHFAVWLIIRNPNIRIMWVGLNSDNAEEAAGAVLDILEHDERLLSDVLGPGGVFKPANKSGRSWSRSSFTVATRVGRGIKSPTMRAIGKGSKLLSKDADLIVLDDIQDDEAAFSPASREKDVHWLGTQVMSRKEDHTAVAVIGSRQDHDDLYGKLLGNPAWTCVVEHAHDPACPLPVHPTRDDHDRDCPDCAAHVDCVLWPEKRPMRFLQDRRTETDNDLKFEMMYLNVTRPGGADPVTVEHLDACRNRTRRIGEYPPDCWLIAGHDPASDGIQGNVLWAVHPETFKRYLVDLEEQPAGGTPAFRKIMREWYERYRLQLWIAEKQNNNDAVLQDPDILRYRAEKGITVIASVTTAQTKWNPDFGIPWQLELFKRQKRLPNGMLAPDPLIDLPFGDEYSRNKIRRYEQQVLHFRPGAKNNGDLLSAGWFPETRIRFWRRDHQSMAEVNYQQTSYFDGGLGDRYKSLTGVA